MPIEETPRQKKQASYPANWDSIFEKSVKSSCRTSRSLACRTPVGLRPTASTSVTPASMRHSRRTPCPTMPVAPNRMAFMSGELRSSLDEGEQIGVDRGRFRGRHAVRKALVGLQRAVLQKLRRQRRGVGVRHDLVVIAVHDKHRHGDLLEVLGEIGLRKGDDPVVMRL